MVRKSKGFRSKTRSLLRKGPRESGKISLSRLLRGYKAGERVLIKIDSSIHKGMPHRRYQGLIGTIMERRGRSYVVKVSLGGGGEKTLIIRPEHLRPSG
ncbi:MAG: 50S ribosomal protein L21e [Candidatus Bathyarchaeia archaeon]|nr:50S ribosomal protein L21e [Candidatus Bathyarchaeota archaeon]